MPARVYSIESIETFRSALLKFQQRAVDALVELDSQMRRAADWIEQDRPAHWRQQAKEADASIHEAKLNLERCLIFRVTDERPSCREERATLLKAQARRDYCREKIERVHHWKRTMHHQLYEYQGRISKLNRMLENDIPRADATLLHILRQLEAYQLEHPPTADPTPTESKGTQHKRVVTNRTVTNRTDIHSTPSKDADESSH